MKKEIKFRVWKHKPSSFEKSMGQFPSLKFFYDAWIASDGKAYERYYDDAGIFSSGWKYEEIVDGIVQQFTGLKDKNGKDIYEGDILQLYRPKQVFYVIFSDGCFVLEPEETGLFLYEENKKSEVIGNIFENPDLLKL